MSLLAATIAQIIRVESGPVETYEEWLLDTTRVSAGYTLSNGNRTVINTSGGADYQRFVPTANGIETGKLYWEVECAGGGSSYNGYVGVVNAARRENYDSENAIFGSSIGYRGNGRIWSNGAQQVSGLPTFGAGDIIMICFDIVTGGFWVGKNGTWSHNPDSSAPTYSASAAASLDGPFYPYVQGRDADEGGTLRSIPSQFSYDVPSTAEPLGFVAPEYTYAVFLEDGTFNVPAGVTEVDVLLVAGGGGGGGGPGANSVGGGGGGAGGVLLTRGHTVTPEAAVAVSVGAGGDGGVGADAAGTELSVATMGGDSTFGALTAIGGGAGGRGTGGDNKDGGSGASSAGAGTPGQGNDGGLYTTSGFNMGGGGGFAAAGQTSTSGASGAGGSGVYLKTLGFDGASGAPSAVGGGGGGGVYNSGAAGVGGLGGGGAGGPAHTNGVSGTTNTGGGGGGAGTNSSSTAAGRVGGDGGSGIVIVRYIAP